MKPSTLRARIVVFAAAFVVAVAAAAFAAVADPAPHPAQAQSLPSTFHWNSTGPLIGPKPDGSHNPQGIKDPTVVYYGGEYHVFASTASSAAGYNLMYTHFSDWSQAGSAPHYYLDRSGIGAGYRAAPEVFYYAPQRLWYLVYQDGNAAYSTNPDISNPAGWTAPKHFYGSMPQIIKNNIGNGYWVDMWVICDTANCHLFSSDDNGHLYRSQTSVANFPNGMSEPVIVMQDSNKYALWEASNVYKVDGSNQYLLIIEAIGSNGRYFRSWTSSSIAGPWSALAASESNPFAGKANVSFPSGSWTNDVSHGEMVRTVVDQSLTVPSCDMRYLYQGRDPNSGGDYNGLPWRLGLLTQTNATCDPGSTTPPTTTPPPTERSGQLRGTASGRCVDVPNQSTTDGTQVQIYDCWTGANQRWTYTTAGELSVYSGTTRKCLDASGGGTANGTAAIIWSCHGGTNQKWNLNANGTITNRQSGLCLDVSGAATANGSKVQLWSCHGGTNQQWTLA
ncbi:hypothetical protein GCM10010403_17170 [Glycomyces rutgersensis]|uniref:non-reducing end alpha-L-arabinofuranosidase n=2 Tax=Glycomyces TaxID=58113 RepID=A0A9X3PEF0_9ACTN|nr:non-reducing end alpha-L-arabinofuranosidase family hydrolase [Glycomyces lechevalierae]MDA1384054.1 non-reducing end alpha-L-arabinofuranosidase family hydrolase [Glycomyces lechevalierae]MDR7340951.1 hypothetical protein [Glycomyces lechevalierae]